jgi:hypothetical protein
VSHARLAYVSACGAGALAGLFVVVITTGDLTMGTACSATATGALLGGLVPVVSARNRVASLPLAMAILALSVLFGALVGVVGGGISPFMWECLLLGCIIGVSVSMPIAMHTLVYRLRKRPVKW